MVADRRLTRAVANGQVEVVDDDAAKMVLLGQQVVVGYTGLANLRPPPRGQTDWWLVEALSPPGVTLSDTFEQLRARANEAFGKMSHVGPRAKRHAFVAAGWAPAKDGPRPFFLSISNALSRYGRWLERSKPEFVTRVDWLSRGAVFRFDETGQPAPHAVKQRVLKELSSPESRSASHVASILARAVRETAEVNETVGKGLLVTVLPRDTVSKTGGLFLGVDELIDLSGQITFPTIDWPTSFYLPADVETGVVYAPHYVDEGLQTFEAMVLNRTFDSDEEVERYAERFIERMRKGMK